MNWFIKLRYVKLFDKVLIVEYPDEKRLIGFCCHKNDFEKIKNELEQFGKIEVEDFDYFVAVEVFTTKDKVSKVLKVLRNIPLLDLGTEVSDLNF